MTSAEGLYPPQNVQMWYDLETAYGTGVGAAAAVGKITSYSSSWSDAVQRLQGLGEGRNETSVMKGIVDVTASMEWQLLANFSSGRSSSVDFLKFAIGGVAGSGTTADPYDIVEAEDYGYTAATDMPTFQLTAAMEGVGVTAGTPIDDTTLFTGCIMPTATISCAQGGLLTAKAEITAQNISCDAVDVSAYTPETGNPMAFQQGKFKFNVTPTEVVHVTNFSITTANNPIIYRELGSRFIQTPLTGQRKWDWSVTTIASSTQMAAMRNDFLEDATTPHTFDNGVTNGFVTADMEIDAAFSEGATSDDLNMDFLLDDAYIMNMSTSASVGGGLVETTFTGGAKSAKTNFVEYYKAT